MFHKKTIVVRLSDEVVEAVDWVMKNYPDDYLSKADVFRSGVFVLKRMKERESQKDA